MKKSLVIIMVVIIIGAVGITWKLNQKEPIAFVTNFTECAKVGNPIMESYPRQCRHGNQTFTENIGNELEKVDLIRISSPRPNQVIESPLTITGEARGTWFFEASFPVTLTNWDGLIIAEGIATAKSNWMTEDFVPFEAKLTFTVDKDTYSNRGTLILQKDNPSGLPEHDDALEIPVILAGIKAPVACTAEARLCPDGSAVGRTGPKCEFAACPTDDRTAVGHVAGQVTIGPFCPVEREGVPCEVPTEAYTSREVIIYDSNGDTEKERVHLDKTGSYKIALGPGNYWAQIEPAGIGPGEKKPFPVTSFQTTTVNFDIDTGIR